MKLRHFSLYFKVTALYLSAAILAMYSFAGPADAMFLNAADAAGTAITDGGQRAADLAKVQAALESKIISGKLMDYGLTPKEAMARMNSLSDQQIHELAIHSDSVQAGGDGGEVIVGLIIVALLVVVLVWLVQGRIQVK